VDSALLAPFAIFFVFKLALHFLFVFFRPVVNALAFTAQKFNQIILTHS